MKFVVELTDFWIEDGDVESALKDHIINEIKNKIVSDLKQKIEDGINREVKSQVEQSLYRRISKLTEEILATDKIKARYSSDPEQTLQEYVQSQFQERAREKAPIDEAIKKLATQFGEEMKKRYDLLFASQLVAKLSESGLMKEDAIKLLLEK